MRGETSGLFPPIDPWSSGRLAVDQRHTLYWEQCGKPDGVAVLFLHGGPGSHCNPAHRRYFDPGFWRIVLFDQRGAGRSTPYADTTDNTTAHLVEDIEALRRHLGIERWLIFGGSWGSTLALAYGIQHPERCLGFVLRGVFLFRKDEVEWFLSGMGRFYPEAQETLLRFLPIKERADPLKAYYRRLMSPNPAIHEPAALIWCAYEEACSRLHPAFSLETSQPVLAMARLETHYMTHGGFLEEGELLQKIGILKNHPCRIVQGRYDIVCPPWTAFELAQAWPGCDLKLVTEAGHSSLEANLAFALVEACEAFKRDFILYPD
jgi:proline iminopeptidase